ncbi:MAG TPA: TIGR04283 family arsenosugar biosynthesis glycosyltransferase, partial [Desulfurivibrionaceae bacterium]|nr:TIGR04283 family arsenosugar biosynthesis glycosyltransferase [Desulfurivibrionaceae bacterium]
IDPKTSTISVIIPTLNEAANLAATLASLRGVAGVEVIVVDGGSSDRSVALAEAAGVRVVVAPVGRGRQQNQGAAVATGEILLFLHGDTRLPTGFAEAVRAALSRPGAVAGAFRLGIAGGGWGLRLVERLANWRSRWLQMPYGDQGLFLRRPTFGALGGFPEQELMEDFELVRRLRKRGHVALLDLAVQTSPRRWQRLGVARTTLVNQLVITAYFFGVSPARLAGWYRGAGGGSG